MEHRVIPWEDVGEEEGTGIVHIAPGCGAEDFELSKARPARAGADRRDRRLCAGLRPARGHTRPERGPHGLRALKQKGLLYKLRGLHAPLPGLLALRHRLVFRVVSEWFICARRDPPAHEGAPPPRSSGCPPEAGKRMEDWLHNMGDWCISRKRYWGLPLPFYVCDCGEVTVGRLAAANCARWPSTPRWWTACPSCTAPGSTRSSALREVRRDGERIPEVGDAWLDAGIVPFSHAGLPGRWTGHGLLGELVPGRLDQRDARADPALVLLACSSCR